MVKLEWYEIAIAEFVAGLRQKQAEQKGLVAKHGFVGKEIEIHKLGAYGEMALAKYLGIYWNGSVNTFKACGDLGDIEVRTRSKSWYDLIVRSDDKDDRNFVLVTKDDDSNFTIRGYISGKAAKQDRWLQGYAGREKSYFVPQSELNSMETLNASRI